MSVDKYRETLSGEFPEAIDVSSQYRDNQITIVGLSSGVVTVKAKAEDSNVYEDVVNGDINLLNSRTIIIRNTPIDSFQFTVSPEAAYTVKIRQSNPIGGT